MTINQLAIEMREGFKSIRNEMNTRFDKIESRLDEHDAILKEHSAIFKRNNLK